MKSSDLEGNLWRLEHKEQIAGERIEFYSMVLDMWKSDQIPYNRIQELAKKYPKFGRHVNH